LSTTNRTWPDLGSNPGRLLTAWAMARPLLGPFTPEPQYLMRMGLRGP
jgi:hypothetical protein